MSDLGARLDGALRAVRGGTAAPAVLVGLYEEAAAQASDAVQKGFFLTHAYVHALESGIDRADRLRDQLRRMGRES